jgi:hypothetical protein
MTGAGAALVLSRTTGVGWFAFILCSSTCTTSAGCNTYPTALQQEHQQGQKRYPVKHRLLCLLEKQLF